MSSVARTSISPITKDFTGDVSLRGYHKSKCISSPYWRAWLSIMSSFIMRKWRTSQFCEPFGSQTSIVRPWKYHQSARVIGKIAFRVASVAVLWSITVVAGSVVATFLAPPIGPIVFDFTPASFTWSAHRSSSLVVISIPQYVALDPVSPPSRMPPTKCRAPIVGVFHLIA